MNEPADSVTSDAIDIHPLELAEVNKRSSLIKNSRRVSLIENTSFIYLKTWA